MVRLCEAVDDPVFGVLLHLHRWKGEHAEQGDALVAPWAMHTHVTKALPLDGLYDAMTAVRDLGYNGCWSIELPTLRMTELQAWVSLVQDVFARWQSGA